jgi:hypothetical protein
MAKAENREQLTPMASYGGQSFFVNEVAQLEDGTYFLTDMFLKRHGELSARGWKLIAQPEVSHSGRAETKIDSDNGHRSAPTTFISVKIPRQ